MFPTIAISEFVKRQTKKSEFSYYNGSWDDLLEIVKIRWRARKPGYREGVVLIPVLVDPEQTNFYSNIVELKEGDQLQGSFKARQEGEEPRKSVGVVGAKKMPAAHVEIVCYSHEVLKENNEQSCDSDWEVISINASPYPENVEVPMPVGTLLANHFQFSGGTATNMTPEEFEDALRKSVEFWKNKSRVYSG